MTSRMRGAVVIGGYANGLQVVRALGKHQIPTAVVSTKPFDIAQHSMYATEHHRLDALHSCPEALLELLDHQAKRWAGWALYPTNDHALEVIATHHQQLSRHYIPTTGDAAMIRPLLDKSFFYDLMTGTGVDLPHRYGPADAQTAARADLRFPVIVKADRGHEFSEQFGVKLFTAKDRPELIDRVEQIQRAKLTGQVYDLIPGADDCFYNAIVYMDARGEPLIRQGVQKLRKSPPFYGVARVARLSDQPELCDAVIEALRKIGYHGIASAEFKRDPRDGRFRLMEINTRSPLVHGLLDRAGMSPIMAAWDEHVEGRRVVRPPNGWDGTWVHLHADLLYAMLFKKQEGWSFKQYRQPYRGPMTHPVWSAHDPKPFVKQWARTFGQAAQSVFSKGTHGAEARVLPSPDALVAAEEKL